MTLSLEGALVLHRLESVFVFRHFTKRNHFVGGLFAVLIFFAYQGERRRREVLHQASDVDANWTRSPLAQAS